MEHECTGRVVVRAGSASSLRTLSGLAGIGLLVLFGREAGTAAALREIL